VNNNNNSVKLKSILMNICDGIDTPTLKKNNHENVAGLKAEQLEIQNYPYLAVACPHQEAKGISEDCVECQEIQYETYKSRFQELVKQKGIEYTHTLIAAFDFYNSLITQYKLTECEELLDLIYPSCISRPEYSSYHAMAIQARAFLYFKQEKYTESLKYFNQHVDLVGPNEKLYENIALVNMRLGQNQQASVCYAKAILLILQKPKEEQNFATLFMSLAVILYNSDDALFILNESMNMLKNKYGDSHSLMAKNLTVMGDKYISLDNPIKACECYSDAVNIFIETCGYETPLTANAMNKQARTLILLENIDKALKFYIDALCVWSKVDDNSFDASMVLEALLFMVDKGSKEESLNANSDKTLDALLMLQNKIKNNVKFRSNPDVFCLLKFIYQLYIIKKNIPSAIVCASLFKDCLYELDVANPYRNQLLEETTSILQIMKNM